MPEQKKIDYRQLEVGYEFSPAQYRLEPARVDLYLKSVEEANPLFRDSGIVPPIAVAANAITALSRDISLPGGAVHVSQELKFCALARVGDTITCRSRVSRKQVRGQIHLITVDFHMVNQDNKTVLNGKTSFILPRDSEDNV